MIRTAIMLSFLALSAACILAYPALMLMELGAAARSCRDWGVVFFGFAYLAWMSFAVRDRK
jgi:hypothetical protein